MRPTGAKKKKRPKRRKVKALRGRKEKIGEVGGGTVEKGKGGFFKEAGLAGDVGTRLMGKTGPTITNYIPSQMNPAIEQKRPIQCQLACKKEKRERAKYVCQRL